MNLEICPSHLSFMFVVLNVYQFNHPTFRPHTVVSTTLMFRTLVLVALGVSSVLLFSRLLTKTSLRSEAVSRAIQIAHSNQGPYEAPLRIYQSPDVIPGSYVVYLERGHTLEQHLRFVGIDLKPLMDGDPFPENSRLGLVYCAELDDATLAMVRRDTGVNLVECNLKPEPVDLGL